MKKIIKYILITIIVLIGIGNLINNSFASDQSDSCYDSYRRKDENGDYKTRDYNFFFDVYDNCSDIRQHDYYTFPNGDKVETWSIWDKTASEIIPSKFNSFKDWANTEKDLYEKNQSGRIGNEVVFSNNFNDVGAFVGCYNSFYVKLIKNGDPCSGKYDTQDPLVYARDTKDPTNHPSGEWQKEDIEIQLFVSDQNYSTGIEYSQYIWDEPTKCKSNGLHFNNGDKITLSEEGTHTLYLCAGDNGNILGGKTCSEKHSGNWEGVFKIDSCLPGSTWDSTGEVCINEPIPTCKSNSKPTDSKLIFNNSYDNKINGTIDYTLNGDKCGFKCSEGTWNTATKKCDIPVETTKTCNENTKPLQENNTVANSHYIYSNQVFSDEDNATQITYTTNGASCNYEKVCDKDYSWNQAKTKCEKVTVCTSNCGTGTPDPICVEGDTRLECINSIPSEIGLPYTNLLAQNYTYKILVNTSNNSAPIDYIKYKIENENTGKLGPVNTINGPGPVMSFNWPMTRVDTYSNGANSRLPNGSREYTLRIVTICDKAGNCTAPKDYIHNVYANTSSFTHLLFSPTTDFTNGKIANGKNENTLNAILKGKYGNQIVTAPPINRTIDFNFNTDNNLNLNQYTNAGNAVELTTPNNSIFSNKIKLGNTTKLFENQKSNNGEYKFNFKIYAPTNINNKFTINRVNVNINQSDSNPNITNINNKLLGNSNVDFNFKPLYTTEFSGEQKSGFIDGSVQKGNIKIEKNEFINTTDRNIYLSKSGNNEGEFNGIGAIDKTDITLGHKIDSFLNTYSFYNFTKSVTSQNPNFKSKFNLKPGSTAYSSDLENITINSWINYKNDSKEITYAGDFVGNKANAANAGLKVQGNTNIDSDNYQDVVANQNEDSIHSVFGRIDKASLRGDLKRKVFSVIKNIDTNSGGVELMNGKVKYFDFTSEISNKILELKGDLGTKTIVVKGANVYVTGNLKVGGIIILKDSNGNGGNLYIDPEVSRIDAIIYADKSIISYNISYGEISPNNGGTYELLKKQLFIKGSVFSENTIGGSRKATPVCPFYTKDDCTLDKAQKYDLNYLRRGIMQADGVTQSAKEFPVIIEYNSQLQLNPPALFGN